MTKADLVDGVVAATKLPKKDVALIVDGFLEAICQTLINNGHVEIRGFGSFKIKFAKARIARNPRSGETVHVPAKLVPYFKVSRELKTLVERADSGQATGIGEGESSVMTESAPEPI
ncbi:MAG: HU family DNA-binding protein [Candidatus Krumholzibacteriia bacterium]